MHSAQCRRERNRDTHEMRHVQRAAKQLLYLGSIRATLKRKCFLAGEIRAAQHTKIKFNGFGGQRTYLGFRHLGRRRAMHINLTGNVDLPELRIPDSKLRTK